MFLSKVPLLHSLTTPSQPNTHSAGKMALPNTDELKFKYITVMCKYKMR